LESQHKRFDEEEGLPKGQAPTSFYAYHTALRGVPVHPLRDAFAYAYLLTETDDPKLHDRAARILRKALTAQDTNPENNTYGIWPYFWEESLAAMDRPDWNWADFCSSEMLFIVYKHPNRLAADLHESVRQSIGHAAKAIRKRDVTGSYTNICALGSFVTLAAARYLKSDDLWDYAIDRLRRFAAYTDQTGSFNEYNSPTYAFVTMRALANILTFVDEPEVQRLAGRLHARVWYSLSMHFHPKTQQLGGPHSRSYDSLLNGHAKLALQVGTQNALTFFTSDNVPGSAPFPEKMVCPEEWIPHFLTLDAPAQRRECFIAARGEETFVQGTTYLHPDFTIGTVNRSDYWHQRRPFVGYWGNAGSGRFMQMRGQKNKHDFTSAHGVTVQEGSCSLTAMNFITGSGDKHPSLDMIKDNQFEAEDMRLRMMLSGVSDHVMVRINGEVAHVGDRFALGDRVTLNLDGVFLGVCYPVGQYAGEAFGEVVRDEEGLWVDCVIYAGENRVWRWAEMGNAGAVAAVWVASASDWSHDNFDRAFADQPINAYIADGRIKATWETPTGILSVSAPAKIGDRKTQSSAFRTMLNGEDVPMTRISEERISD
jgi:hypothetical protein